MHEQDSVEMGDAQSGPKRAKAGITGWVVDVGLAGQCVVGSLMVLREPFLEGHGQELPHPPAPGCSFCLSLLEKEERQR